VTDDTKPTPPLPTGPLPEGGPAPEGVDEFAGIPSARQRHPVIVLGTAALACFLIFQVKDDLRFAVSSAEIQNLGDARQVSGKKIQDLPINRMVRLAGKADRESGVILDTQGSWNFGQFFRLLGTNNRIFVKRTADPLPAELAARDVFTGRLMRFSDLSFQAAIRRYFSGHMSATHFFAPAEVRAALTKAPSVSSLPLTDRLGDQVSLHANDELTIEMARPGQIRIDFPRDRFPNPAAAQAAVEGQGGQVIETPRDNDDPKSLALVVTFPPERRDQALHALGEMDPKVHIRPARTSHKVRIADLSATDDAILIKTGGQALPMSQIQAISTQAAVEIPDDALIVFEGERPREHLKTVIIAVFLLGFAIVNLLALRRRDS
jgi:hypothetical protein